MLFNMTTLNPVELPAEVWLRHLELVSQLTEGATPKAKGSLVVNFDNVWKVRERDDIDVVARGGRRRCEGRMLDETWEALAISIGSFINPVFY